MQELGAGWCGGAQTDTAAMYYARGMVSSQQPPPATNRLLEALPGRDRHSLLAACETVRLVSGETLNTTGRINRVYYPTSGFISLVMSIDGPTSLDVGLIGNEGACGFQLALGIKETTMTSTVQGSGSAVCMKMASFTRHLADSKPLARLMGRYVNVQLNQLAQLAACTRFHVVEERLARWLLMAQDRAHDKTFHLTHRLLGSILGVRRVGITKAAGALQDRGLIDYVRGRITVLDRAGLIAAACGCYEADRDFYAQMFG